MITSPSSKSPLHTSVERQGGYHMLGALIIALPAEVLVLLWYCRTPQHRHAPMTVTGHELH